MFEEREREREKKTGLFFFNRIEMFIWMIWCSPHLCVSVCLNFNNSFRVNVNSNGTFSNKKLHFVIFFSRKLILIFFPLKLLKKMSVRGEQLVQGWNRERWREGRGRTSGKKHLQTKIQTLKTLKIIFKVKNSSSGHSRQKRGRTVPSGVLSETLKETIFHLIFLSFFASESWMTFLIIVAIMISIFHVVNVLWLKIFKQEA